MKKFNKGDWVWFIDKYTFEQEIEAGVVVANKPFWYYIIPTGEVEPVLIDWDDVYNDREEAFKHRTVSPPLTISKRSRITKMKVKKGDWVQYYNGSRRGIVVNETAQKGYGWATILWVGADSPCPVYVGFLGKIEVDNENL